MTSPQGGEDWLSSTWQSCSSKAASYANGGVDMRVRYFSAGFLVALILSAAIVWATAQSVPVDPVTPRVVTGADVGFRVEGLRGGSTPVGTVVIRVNGEWVQAEVTLPGRGTTTPLSSR